MTYVEKQAREQEMNKKFEGRTISADNTKYSLEELNKVISGDTGIQVDCSKIELYIGGSQGVTNCKDVLEYGKDFTSLDKIGSEFYELLSTNAYENLDDYLDDLLDGQDPDEIDEDELAELKGEAQAEAECDSGERQIIFFTTDGGRLYFDISDDTLEFSHCYYF